MDSTLMASQLPNPLGFFRFRPVVPSWVARSYLATRACALSALTQNLAMAGEKRGMQYIP